MYEDKTYDTIMDEALEKVTSDIDTREGSFIYDAIGPFAYQLAQIYFSLDNFIDLVMLDTAVGEYLDRKAAEFGETRKAATAAVRTVTTSAAIDLGTRWELNDLVYEITEKVTDTSYRATCETEGTVGNTDTGEMESLDNISGITAALGAIVTSGADEETDDALRGRVFEIARKPSASGNATDYKTWATAVTGVGDAKVFPTWNGAGTVKVLIVDSDKDIDESLEDDVFAYIETCRPVGATVTVDSPTAKAISVSATITLEDGAVLSTVNTAFETKLLTYLRSLVFTTYTVSYAKIGALLLDTDGITDYTGLTVNAGTESIIIGTYEAPTIGTVSLTEASE